MRIVHVFLLALGLTLFWGYSTQSSGTLSVAAPVFAADPPQNAPVAPGEPKAPEIDVHINGGGTHEVWYFSPLALVVGGAVLILVLGLFAIAARGSGTTIIREQR